MNEYPLSKKFQKKWRKNIEKVKYLFWEVLETAVLFTEEGENSTLLSPLFCNSTTLGEQVCDDNESLPFIGWFDVKLRNDDDDEGRTILFVEK